MIIVTGATGQLGSQVVEQLLERLPAGRLGVSVRRPEKAVELAARGVRVRRGDFADPASLAAAFEGASQVLLVSVDGAGADAVAQHATAIRAAGDAGVQRVLYTSHQGAAVDSAFGPMPDHAATEAELAASGLPFTSLRHGFYASTIPFLLGPALQTGEILAPADGPVSWTTHADLAAADALVLADGGRFEGISPPLTAPVAHDLADVARMLSDITGRTIRRTVVEDEDFVQTLVGHGLPAARASMVLGIYAASRRGEFAATDPALEELLGRPATSVQTLLEGIVAGA